MSGIRIKGLPVLGLALAAAACQPLSPAGGTPPAEVQPGLAFATGTCGGCHAIDRRSVSPNPSAPPFAAIVNQDGAAFYNRVAVNTAPWWLKAGANNFTIAASGTSGATSFALRWLPRYRSALR